MKDGTKFQIQIVSIGLTLLSLIVFGGAFVSPQESVEKLAAAGFTKVELIDKKWALWNWCVPDVTYGWVMSAEMTFQVVYNNEPPEIVSVCDSFGMDPVFDAPHKQTKHRLVELNLK